MTHLRVDGTSISIDRIEAGVLLAYSIYKDKKSLYMLYVTKLNQLN